jgi:hypothetical protein
MTYSSSLALGRQRTMLGRNQNAVSFRRNERTLGPFSNTIILIVLACLLGPMHMATRSTLCNSNSRSSKLKTTISK